MRSKPKSRRRTQKVSGGLKGFSDARKPAIDLLRDIQTHVVAEGVRNQGVGREDHKIHVSELVKDVVCPRYLFYKVSAAERTDPPAPAYHRLEMIWATGHDAHHKWQRWLREMGDLWGTWTCTYCGDTWEGIDPECGTCRTDKFTRYDEVDLYDHELFVVGHADGAVPRLNALVEVKSFAVGSVRIDNPKLVTENTHKFEGRSVVDHEGLWAAIKRPLKSHLKQGIMYLWLCKRMGLPYDRIIFIYENKTTQATKTFEVKLSMRFIQEHVDVLEDVVARAKTGDTPARPKLFAPDAKPCKDCPFRTLCWSEEKDDDVSTTASEVPARRPRSRSEAPGGTAEVQPARPSRNRDSGDPGRHHRRIGSHADRDDDAADPVGRAPRGATGDGRGRRALGGSRDGEGEGARPPRFRPRRDREEG